MTNNKILNHIQFLRGLSVLLVFCYHLELYNFKYGFLGVDIFFVISGYVITSRIFAEYQIKKKFNFANFYLRRVKRIYPVLVFVLTITLFFIIFFQPLDLFLDNFKVYFFSIIGFSNFFYLFSKKDYFDTVFNDPLAHTWSLGIEEQFYFIFPIFFIFILSYLKSIQNILSLVIFFIVLGIIATFIFQFNQKLIFYSPIFRFWEFLIGTFTFLASTKIRFKNNLISILALFFLIILIIFVVQLNYLFLILISTILSAVFILMFENSKNQISNFIIENKFFVFFGNISYSFYLWHLPIIYFYDLYFIENILRVPFISLVTIGLSVFSFYFVEKRFRYKSILGQKNQKKTVIILLCFFCIFSFIFFISLKNSFNNQLKKGFKTVLYNLNFLENKLNFTERTVFYKIKIGDHEIYRFCTENIQSPELDRDNLRVKCLKKQGKKDRIFFVEGNSHTANFIPMFNSLKTDDVIYFNHVSSPLFKDINFELINNLTKSYKQVIYSTNINTIQSLNLFDSLTNKFNKNVKILILGPIPHLKKNINPLECFIKNIDCIYKKKDDFSLRNLDNLLKNINKITENNKNVLFFNPYESICQTNTCYAFNKKKNLLTHRDDSHLTIEGSLLMKNDFNKFYKIKFD